MKEGRTCQSRNSSSFRKVRGVKGKVALLVATTYNLQFGGYEAATPFHEHAVQPLLVRPASPRVASVAGIMQLLHCARQLSRKTASA